VQFNFDPGKDAVNLSEHGLSLAAAAELKWEAALVWIDDRADYGELRMVALAPIGGTLYFAAFVDRESTRRGNLEKLRISRLQKLTKKRLAAPKSLINCTSK